MENEKQYYAFILWFLACITVSVSFYFLANYHRTLQALALFLLVGGYWLTRKGIYEIWDEKKFWWQDNECIRWNLILHSVFFVVTSLFIVNDFIFRSQLVQEGANLALSFLLFFAFLLLSWLSGTAALNKVEKEFLARLSPPHSSQRSQQSQSYTKQVLRPVGYLWLAPTNRGM